MKLRTVWKTLIITATMLFSSYALAAPPTPISSCGTVINASGNYFLAQNLICTGSTAVIIAASKVDLDLKGFTIDGGGASGFGISTSSSQMASTGDLSLCLAVTNIHIHGGTVKGYGSPDETTFGAAIILCSPNPPPGPAVAMSVQLDHLVLTSNEFGVELISTAKNKIADNYMANNDVGVGVANGCTNNALVGNLLDGNGTGLELKGPNNTVDSNVAINNSSRGILVTQVASNTQTTNNYASHNAIGIEAQEFSAGNIFNGNTAFANSSFDLSDDNGNCTNNTWKGNFFATSSPGCIQ
jgi:parallel beta-helix repeat protein